MEVSIHKQSGLDAVLSVKVNAADYQEDLEKSLNEYRKKVNLPGFRQGKVPMGVVRKMFEKDAKRELIEKFLQKNIQDYINTNDVKLVLNPLSTYIADDIDWKNNDFEFTYDIGLRPEINLDLKKLNSLTKYKIEVSDEDVNEEISRLRKQAGQVQHQEEVTKNDDLHVTLHFHELDDEGKELEGGLHKVKMFPMAELPKKLFASIEGKKRDEKLTVNLTEVLSADEIADLFGVDKATVKDLNASFEVEIKGVFTVAEPEMNQEFFSRYFDPEKVTTEEEFRAEWKKMIENYFEGQANNALAREIKQYLMDHVELELPENFIKKYFLLSYEAKSEADVENYEDKRKGFDEELKWLILAEFVAETQDIKINEEEVIAYTEDMIRAEFGKNGLADIEPKQLRQYAINYLSQENNFNRTSLALRDGKVFDYLLSQVQPKEEKVGTKKFEELRKKK